MALKDLMKEDLKEVEEAGAKVKPEPFFVGALKQRYNPFFAISYQAYLEYWQCKSLESENH